MMYFMGTGLSPVCTHSCQSTFAARNASWWHSTPFTQVVPRRLLLVTSVMRPGYGSAYSRSAPGISNPVSVRKVSMAWSSDPGAATW